MRDWTTIINFSVGIAGMMLAILGLLMAIVFRFMDRTTRGYLVWIFSLLIVYTASVFVSQIADFMPHPGRVLTASVFMESLSSWKLLLITTIVQ